MNGHPGFFPCPQRPLAQTRACRCPPSELSMPLTSDCGVGPSRLRTKSPPFLADNAWYCTSLQSPRRSYLSGHRDHSRPSETSDYACLWGAKVGMEKSLASIAAEGWIPMAAVLDFAQLQAQPLTSGCCPSFQKGRNYCLCSRAGNSGMPLLKHNSQIAI